MDSKGNSEKKKDLTCVGKSVRRVDGWPKVLGKAKYTADHSFEGMLFAAVKRADFPHARIKSIDVEGAQLPGVEAIMLEEDIPGNPRFGALNPHQPVIISDIVRYLGDGIALVAAKSEKIAREAAKRIVVSYEELPGLFDPREARKSELSIHPEGNEIVHHVLRKGEVSEGFAAADVVLERDYQTQFQEHAYLEPEAAVAVPQPDGGITVYGSMQHPFSTRRVVARVLGLPLAKVRVIQGELGGGFGGKDESSSIVCARAALLALKTGKPVKLVNTREESFVESYKRHPYYLHYKVGAKKDGTLTAMEIEIVADGGAYASMSTFVTWRSVVQATGPYTVPNVKTDVYAYHTNNTYTGAFRGFGSPQIVYASESLMDELAAELKISPAEIRKKNFYQQGGETATGQTLKHVVSLEPALDAVLAELNKKPLEQNANPVFSRGRGFACSYRGVALGAEGVDATGAVVNLLEDGSAIVSTGVAENGQGLRTVFSQIVSEELGIPLEKIVFLDCDTSSIADGGPSVASRCTIMGGNAVRHACLQLKERLNLSEQPDLQKAIKATLNAGKSLYAFGWHNAPKVSWDEHTGQGDAYFTYVYACQGVEVEVNNQTGETKVLRAVAAHDVGMALNPQQVELQIYGGVTMGAGYGLTEEVILEKGVTKNPNFNGYHIPDSRMIGEIVPIIIENPDAAGPFGAKTIGEPTCELLAPAIANAILQATGARVRTIPATPARVLHAMQKEGAPA
ncbi:MAG TPA: xanthine dehydrogenase [Cyanobacteria bacterium UBA8530]|nr:xanthine dehydrogenase [Cyanobacteria bacterium UBA8530]